MPITNDAGESRGGELRVLGAIRSMLGTAGPTEVWIGDDAAVVTPPDGALLLTVDMTVEGVHADLTLVGLDDLGWRAVSTSVSDIAAMGAVADQLLVSVAAPPATDMGALYSGIAGAAELCGAAVVGGDLSTASQVMVAVTVVGHTRDGGPPVLRSGAAAGDFIFVTGPLGAAAAGLRLLRALGPDSASAPAAGASDVLLVAHKRPVARLAEGETARRCGATAMIDLSDGIAADIRRIAEASGVGVRMTRVPVADGAVEEEAICGGDDYELLFTARDPDAVVKAFQEAGLREPCLVGECMADPTELTLGGGPLRNCGWEHPF